MSSSPKEHDYIGLTEPPYSMEKTSPSSSFSSSIITKEDDKSSTELRLGLPGSYYPENKPAAGDHLDHDNKQKHVSGAKRVFSDALNEPSGKWVFSDALNEPSGKWVFSNQLDLGPNEEDASNPLPQPSKPSTAQEKKVLQVSENCSPPASKAQAVGWPPIRSFRKNSMASINLMKKSDDDLRGKSKSGVECLYVKVSMDGAPYLRKVDLKVYTNYKELSLCLEKMFSCFTIGRYNGNGVEERDDGLSESGLKDLLHGSEYVLTYEDKDGDWMLVGDVPWEMFTFSCKRMRIMKGTEAIGLAPRATEKCKSRT